MSRAAFIAACAVGATAQTVPISSNTLDSRACQPPYDQFPFCNTALSLDARVKDIIGRLQGAEIPPQLTARHNGGDSPGPQSNVSRLGLPTYDWGMNALHGVQSSCVLSGGVTYCPTSFPNPINFGMTFNKSLAAAMGSIIGLETRALWLAGAVEASGWSGRNIIGLDAWSPNINLMRDPRWGRNCEVPSEDPYWNGVYGQYHTQGLQVGSDPKYLQAVVTLKHFDAYSLEDSDGFTRHNFNAVISPYGLADAYFPAFRRSIMQGGAKGVMCAYNSVNGFPSCASPQFSHVLRNVWGFQGYITSDTGAVEDIYQQHNYVPTEVLAAAVAIANGTTDVCSGGVYMHSLMDAVSTGVLSMDAVNAALYNTFSLRFQLGLFDPVSSTPYWSVPLSAVNTSDSRATSMLATLSSMVLLKNSKGALPLPAGKNIAVIGPQSGSGGANSMVGNYLGQLCPDNTNDCITTVSAAISAMNTGGTTTQTDGCQIKKNDTSGFAAAVAAAKAADIVVLALGTDGTVEGESNDRTSIDLPAIQHELVAAVAAAGKPMVIVLIHGGSVDISTENSNTQVVAILEAGFPGVFGGAAIAATLFGANDHLGGKLPYTVYPASFTTNMPMTEMELDTLGGKTYRYYTGPVIFPFGYGLSLSSFTLALASGPASTTLPTEASPSSFVNYTVQITNTGGVTADEVVQAYFAPSNLSKQPDNKLIKQLFDFGRVHLAAGASTTLSFNVSSETFRLPDKATGNIVSTPGTFTLSFTNGVDQSVAAVVNMVGSEVTVNTFPY